MARSSAPDARYRIRIRRNGGYVYASTQPPVTDEKTGRTVYRHVNWGRVENGKFLPGSRYFQASPEERSKLIFPADWDLSAIEGTGMTAERTGSDGLPVQEAGSCRLYGDMWLLEQIAEKTGLRQDLLRVTEGDDALVGDILTLAVFPLVTEWSADRLPGWQKTVKTPASQILTPAVVTGLVEGLSAAQLTELSGYRTRRAGSSPKTAVETVSFFSEDLLMSDRLWGADEENQCRVQSSDLMICSETDHLPVALHTYPGTQPALLTLSQMLAQCRRADDAGAVLITDRGETSVRAVELMLASGLPFITAVGTDSIFAADRIRAYGTFSPVPASMQHCPETGIYYESFDAAYPVEVPGQETVEKALTVCLFFDPDRRAALTRALDMQLERQRETLQTCLDQAVGIDEPDGLSREFAYFRLTTENGRLTAFEADSEAIDEARRSFGFSAVLTYGVNDTPMEIFSRFSLREEQAAMTARIKAALGFDRVRSGSGYGRAGRELILFVALTLANCLSHVRRSKGLAERYASDAEMLDEMRPVLFVTSPDQPAHMTPFDSAQMRIVRAFGLGVPAQ